MKPQYLSNHHVHHTIGKAFRVHGLFTDSHSTLPIHPTLRICKFSPILFPYIPHIVSSVEHIHHRPSVTHAIPLLQASTPPHSLQQSPTQTESKQPHESKSKRAHRHCTRPWATSLPVSQMPMSNHKYPPPFPTPRRIPTVPSPPDSCPPRHVRRN